MKRGRLLKLALGWSALLGLIATILFFISEDRRALLYYRVRINLGNIYNELELYDEAYGNLPAATTTEPERPEMSWRVALVSNPSSWGWGVDNDSGEAAQYDPEKAWDDPANLRLDEIYNRYSSRFGYKPRQRHRDVAAGNRKAYYKAIVGTDTAFEPGVPRSLADLPHDLILVVRVEESKVHWMQPGDVTLDDFLANATTKDLLLGDNGYAVLFADGEMWVLSGSLPFSELRKFVTITGANRFDRDKLLGPFQIMPFMK